MNYSDEMPSILNIAEGGAVELFDLELARVFKNLSNPNRTRDAEREVVLTVKFKPTDAKSIIDTKISVKSKLAPRKVLSTLMHVENGEGRELVQKQRSLFNHIAEQIMPKTSDLGLQEVDNDDN